MPTATLLLSPVVGRRTGYQEVVHRSVKVFDGNREDDDDHSDKRLSQPNQLQDVFHRECRSLHSSISCPVTRLASCLAEWLVVLQKVAEDRGPEQPSISCRCEKASRLCEDIQSLGRRVAEAGQVGGFFLKCIFNIVFVNIHTMI